MLTIYSSTTTSFSNLGYGVLKDFSTNPKINEELNGIYSLEFEYVSNGFNSEYLIEGNIIKANGQPFRIYTIKKTMEKINVYAKHLFFDLQNNFLIDIEPVNKNAQNAISYLFSHSVEPVPFIVNGDCTSLATSRFVRKNVIDSIYNEDNAILKRFGGELELDNYNVFVHNKRGLDKGYSIRYRKNLSAVELNLDFSTVATVIMPQGNDELLLDDLYVRSPKVNDYFSPIYRKVEFDIGIDEETTEEQAKEKLRTEALKLFENGIDVPEISVKVDFVELSKCEEYKEYSNLETCDLGDTIQIIIPHLNINASIRIVKKTFDCVLNRITNLELGTVTPNIATESVKNNNEINNALKKVSPTEILRTAKEDATKLINHPFNGNVYIDENSGCIYLLDTNNPNTATNVWKWSMGGFGFSDTGINGTYNTAITQDGTIVADFIKTGQINTNLIEGYESLTTTVSDISTITIPELNEMCRGLDERIETTKQTILEQTSESFTMWFEETGLQSDLDDIQTMLHDNTTTANTLKEYIHFEGAEITLGKTSSQTKLVIKNDRISFMTGNVESAYISENTLYITDSTILNKLQIGHWETKEDDLGNLNTKWIGGD